MPAIAAITTYCKTFASYCQLSHAISCYCKPLRLLNAIVYCCNHCGYASCCSPFYCEQLHVMQATASQVVRIIAAVASYYILLASYLQALHGTASFCGASYFGASYCKPWGYCKLSSAIAAITGCCIASFCIASDCKPSELLQHMSLQAVEGIAVIAS